MPLMRRTNAVGFNHPSNSLKNNDYYSMEHLLWHSEPPHVVHRQVSIVLTLNRCHLPEQHLHVFVVGRSVKSSVVWDMTPCSPLKVSRGLFGLFIDPEDEGDMFLQNVS
jgi:hypothetical protein